MRKHASINFNPKQREGNIIAIYSSSELSELTGSEFNAGKWGKVNQIIIL